MVTTAAPPKAESDAKQPAQPQQPPQGSNVKRSILPPASPLPQQHQPPQQKKRKTKALEKSTTTKITTETAQTPVNVYDAVLGEAQDLLQASQEAQALGRLKMASAYQLLLHARLVGLGKRFDRAPTVPSESAAAASPSTTASAGSSSGENATTPDNARSSTLQTELSKILPTNIEMDSAMMEHLARAAMELHHQRTGRRIQSDSIMSPQPPVSGSTAITTTTTNSNTSPGTTTIAWTEEERDKIAKAIQDGTTDPAKIVALLKTRNEAQVKLYMKNNEDLKSSSEKLEKEIFGADSPTKRRGGRGRKPPTTAMNTVPNAKLDAKALLSGKGLP